ncbi:MAG: nitroreductase family protein [Clostridia bacterium]|nr:nitroreductase family protein [Clostridia bacterium]
MENPILKRRSVRKFKETPVSREMIDKLLEAAMAAPSACNKRPVDFYVITDEEKLQEISMAGRFTRMKAPLIILVVGNLKRALPLQLADYWIHDAAAASENILIEATALGLGSCWCGIHPQKRMMQKVSQILGLGEKQLPFSLIKIGHPDEFPEPHSGYDKSRVTFLE